MPEIFNIPKEKWEQAHAAEMAKFAKEPVTVELLGDGDLCIFASEIGCLRIAYKFRNDYNMRVLYSENLTSWTITLYKYHKTQ